MRGTNKFFHAHFSVLKCSTCIVNQITRLRNLVKIFPAPQTIEDLENFPELHQQHLEQRRNQA